LLVAQTLEPLNFVVVRRQARDWNHTND
jgi:hypothetical protein